MLGGYEAWASQKRAEVKRKLEEMEPEKMARLNEATQQAFQVVERHNQSLRDDVASLRDAVARESVRNSELALELARFRTEQNNLDKNAEAATRKLVKEELAEHATQMHSMLQSLFVQQREQGGIVPNARTQPRLQETRDATSTMNANPPPHATIHNNQAQPPPLPLQSVAFQPDIGGRFPSSWVKVLELWNTKNLADFVIHEKKTWIPKVRGRFQKYLQAFKCIEHAALTHRDLSAAAKFLDDKMGKQCMSDFLAKQMKKHPGIKSRKSKQKPAAGATAAVRTARGRGRQPQQQRQQQRNRTQQNLPLFFAPRQQHPPSVAALPSHLRDVPIAEQNRLDWEEDVNIRRAVARRRTQTEGTRVFEMAARARTSASASDGNKKRAAQPNRRPHPTSPIGEQARRHIRVGQEEETRINTARILAAGNRNRSPGEILQNGGERYAEIVNEQRDIINQRNNALVINQRTYRTTNASGPHACQVEGGCRNPNLSQGFHCRNPKGCSKPIHQLCCHHYKLVLATDDTHMFCSERCKKTPGVWISR